MRKLKFRFWLGDTMQGILELEQGSILDMPWEWDKVDQFTGLLDRLGKDIYEGDWIRWTEPYTENVQIQLMEWVEHGFWMRHKSGQCHLPNQEYLEVIGNIYEHSHLLEE